MDIENWYNNPKKFNGNNLDVWLKCCKIFINLELIKNNFLEEKNKLFTEIIQIKEFIYENYKINEEIKFKNDIFLSDFFEENINKSHILDDFYNSFDKYKHLSFEEKLNIIESKKNKQFKYLSDDINILDW